MRTMLLLFTLALLMALLAGCSPSVRISTGYGFGHRAHCPSTYYHAPKKGYTTYHSYSHFGYHKGPKHHPGFGHGGFHHSHKKSHGFIGHGHYGTKCYSY